MMTTVTDSESDAAGLERDHAVPVLMRVLQGFKRHSLGRPGDCSLGRNRPPRPDGGINPSQL